MLNIPEFVWFLMNSFNSSKFSWILTQRWPNSDLKNSNGSVPRRSNLSTKILAWCWRHPQTPLPATPPASLEVTPAQTRTTTGNMRSTSASRGADFSSWRLSWKVRSARDRTIRTFKIRVRSEFFHSSGIVARKFKNFGNFQHFLNYRRNSDKISSKSEQKSVKII